MEFLLNARNEEIGKWSIRVLSTTCQLSTINRVEIFEASAGLSACRRLLEAV